MNNECESDHKHYTCECGKSFDRLNQMTGHQAKCKVHKAILETELESRRLPNGLFKCENPDCNNEHDGSQHYDGRFPERIKHDIERDIYLKSQGWKVLRLRWKYVYKQKKYWIKIAKRFIDNC